MKIWFYDVSPSQELAHLNGRPLTFSELYDHHSTARPSWSSLPLSREKYVAMDFHPYRVDEDRGRLWLKYFSTTCQILTGHSISKEEKKIVREFIRRLPHDFKKSYVDQRFVLSFITYLFVGFKAHMHEGFGFDSNAIDSLVKFTLAMCTRKRVFLTSFLCAHREPKAGPGKPLNLLQARIPSEKIRRAGSLLLALAHNASASTNGSAVFLQQGPNYTATSSVFPEVSVEYFLNARAYEMLERLQYQYQLVEQTLKELPGERVNARIVTLDVLTKRIERFLRDRYSSNWRQINFTNCINQNDPLAEIAVRMTLPDVERMMPFFSRDFKKDFLGKKDEILKINQITALKYGGAQMAFRVTQVIEWFTQQHSMTISAKAMYETAFYYLWGRYCGSLPGVLAVGFDRDHERFQHFAWECGAKSVARTGVRLQMTPLYARRNPTGHKHGWLADLSFRQFWRDEP